MLVGPFPRIHGPKLCCPRRDHLLKINILPYPLAEAMGGKKKKKKLFICFPPPKKKNANPKGLNQLFRRRRWIFRFFRGRFGQFMQMLKKRGFSHVHPGLMFEGF